MNFDKLHSGDFAGKFVKEILYFQNKNKKRI